MKRDKKIVIIGLDGANKNTAKFVGLDTKNVYDLLPTIPPYTPSMDVNINWSESTGTVFSILP